MNLITTELHESWLTLFPALLAILVLFLPALLPSTFCNRHAKKSAHYGSILSATTLFLAFIVLVRVMGWGSVHVVLLQQGIFQVSLLLDSLSSVMFFLVAFLSAVVTRYSRNYLDGDPDRGHFMKWLCLTSASVLLLVISGNLLLFLIAWIATSMSLHKLLLFYPERPAAVLAARKKFYISRIGDLCILAALILTYQYFGTWDFPQLFSLAGELKNNGSSAAPSGLFWIPLLLVAGALIKSAQFPFHSWLPDTMETPTPVSALMHAGIINAGGFLIIRLSPIVSLSPASLNGLAIIGAITALYASVVMLTQTSIKRSLAYSTIAQMGFMMLQCGLGAFSLAMLHIVAHSLYKAHAFLSSGSIVQMARHAWVPKGNPSAHPLILISSMLLAILITLGMGTLFNLSWQADVGVQVLGCVMMMALAHFLWSLWGSGFLPKLLFWGFGITTLSAFLYYSLHTLSYALFANSLPNYAPARSTLEYVVMALIVALFFTVLLFQSQVATWSRHSFWQTLYVHAYNGFYLGTLTSRLMGRKDTRARL